MRPKEFVEPLARLTGIRYPFRHLLVHLHHCYVEPTMKKLFLLACTLVTVAGGSTLLWAQTELVPCSPVPNGCRVIDGCKCTNVGGTKVCSDVIECGGT